MTQQIEIFIAGCPVCEPVVALVKETVSNSQTIIIHNLALHGEDTTGMVGIKKYDIKRLPAIVVNGKLMNPMEHNIITKDDLVNAGIGNN